MAHAVIQSVDISEKIILDVTACIGLLKSQFEVDLIPITDDNLTFQKFCAKLEFLLQHYLKERTSVLGTKKNYWDYFCQCLSGSRKQVNDGIRFVKLKQETKTSQGRGRAFLRFCLTHSCLADTLQCCFSQVNITKEWYHEAAIPASPCKWSSLVSSLYDLNDIHFDLSPECHELDISWPTFSRRSVDARLTWRPPSRSMSITSLVSQIEDDVDRTNSFSQSSTIDVNVSMAEEYASKVEILTLQQKTREKYFAEAERISYETIRNCQDENSKLSQKLESMEKEISAAVETKEELLKHIQDLNLEKEELKKDLDLSKETLLESKENKKEEIQSETNQKLIAIKSSNSELREENALLKQQLSQAMLSVQETTQEKGVLEILIQNLNSQLAELEGKRDSIKFTEEDDKLSKEMAEMKSQLKNCKAKIEFLEKEKEGLKIKKDKLQRSNNAMELELKEKMVRLEKADEQSASLVQYGDLLVPLLSQQELLTDQLHQNIEILDDACHQLKTEMLSLTKTLQKTAQFLKSDLEFPSLTKMKALSIPHPTSIGHEFSEMKSTQDYPLVNSTRLVLNRLQIIYGKNNEMNALVHACRDLCADATAFAQERESKLMARTISLQQSLRTVENLSKEHKHLQEAESILKYELHEKRKLLTRLRQQLETTREDWNRVRNKNLESQSEWKSLRAEFAKRYKQSSEESGFLDEKQSEETNTERIESPSQLEPLEAVREDSDKEAARSSTEGSPMPSPLNDEPMEAGCMSEPIPESEIETTRPRRRLEILEEQCNLLYFSLLHSSKKSELLEQRLEALLGPTRLESNDQAGSSQTVPKEIKQLNGEMKPSTPEEESVSGDCSSLILDEETIEEDEENNSSSAENPIYETDKACFVEPKNGFEEVHPSETEVADLEKLRALSPENRSTRKTLEGFVTRFKNERAIRDSKETDLRYQIVLLEKINFDFEKRIAQLEEENASVSTKELDFRKRAEFIFRKERDAFQLKLQGFTTELNALKEINCNLQSEIKLKDKELEKAAMFLEENHREKQEVEKGLCQEITSLKFQLSTETLKCERALKNCTGQESGLMEMRVKVANQEQVIQSLEESLVEIREERNTEQEKQRAELDKLQNALFTRDEECTSMNLDIKQLTRELDETKLYLAQVEGQSQAVETAYQAKINKYVLEMNEFIGDNEELKRQVIKLTKDKDRLWKKSEHLCEFQSPALGDRWMDDKEVKDCLGCKSPFSFTLRKHHCRICGRIFCHYCASNWLKTVSSSGRSRACNQCFNQATEKGSPWEESQAEETSSDPSNQSQSSEILSPSLYSLPQSVPNSEGQNLNLGLDDSVTQPTDPEGKLDFDVISDEEITRSLSACSPYSSAPSPSDSIKSESSRVQSSVTRTLEDIISAGPDGCPGEFWVTAGNIYMLPVLIEDKGVILSWEFSSDPKSISFSVAYKENQDKEQEVLLKTTRVQSHLRPVQGHLKTKHPGLYMLIFDNHFSKFMAKKVTYHLSVETTEVHRD